MTYNELFTILGKICGQYSAFDGFVSNTTNNMSLANSKICLGNFSQDITSISSNISAFINSINSLSTTAKAKFKTALDNYILTEVKSFVSSSNSTVALVLADLIADMTTEVETVLTSGNFYNFFYDVYGVELPVNSSPTIDENFYDIIS